MQVRQKRKSKCKAASLRNCFAKGNHSLGSTVIVSHCPPSSNTAVGSNSAIFIFNSSFCITILYLRLFAHGLNRFLFFVINLSMHAAMLPAWVDNRLHIHPRVSHDLHP